MMTLRKQYVATGYVYDSHTDAFLLIFHKKLGKWLPPGGHLYEGEVPHLGVQRELLEETGLKGRIVDLLKTPDVGTTAVAQLYTPFCILSEIIPASVQEEEHIHIDFVYVVEVDASQTLNIDTKEVSIATWFSPEGIKQIETFENVRQVCRTIRRLWVQSPRHFPGARL